MIVYTGVVRGVVGGDTGEGGGGLFAVFNWISSKVADGQE